jgi:hypothetical protein
MLARQNYLKVKLFLKFSREVQGRSLAQVSIDFNHLKYLLHWAGSQPLGSASNFGPTLSNYLYQEAGKGIHHRDVESILVASQRYFLWAKTMFPVEFQEILLSWIMNLKTIPNRKEVIL